MVSDTFSAVEMAFAVAVALCVVVACCEADWTWLVPKQNATQPSCVCITSWIVVARLTASAAEGAVVDPVAVAVCDVEANWLADWVWLVP